MDFRILSPVFMKEAAAVLPLGDVFFLAFYGFAALYFSWAALGFFYGRLLLQKMGWGTILDRRKLFKGQIFYEIRNSFVSVAVFAAYGVLTLWAYRKGWVNIRFEDFSIARFLGHTLILVLWNEIHFYSIHRFLHRPWWFKRVHEVHHRSVTTTPFSTYSFHVLEALALSSVMILAMFFWNFDVYPLLVFPAVSLMANSIGHLNFTVFSDHEMNHVASASRRHAAHHRFFSGNFGFLLPYMDRWFSSAFDQKKDFKKL
jgi:Delta7-sterol 5-desaturase